MRLPKSVLGVLAAGALLLGGAVPAVAEDAVPGDGPTTSVSAPADEAGGAESDAQDSDNAVVEEPSSQGADGSLPSPLSKVMVGRSEDRAANVVQEPVIEAKLTAGGNTLVDLGDSSTTVQLNRGQSMNLEIHAVFPVATEKRIDITLKPGVRYRGDAFALDKTQGWVQELKDNGQTVPSKQADSAKKPTTIYGANMNDGVLSYEFQDTTQEVTFMVPIQLVSHLDGALTVPEGVTVEQSYVDEAGAQANEKLTTTTSLKNPRVLNTIGRNDVWNKVNAQGNIEVGLDDPRGTTETVKWIASANDRSQIVVDDYFFALLVPAKAEYLGLYTKQGGTDVSDADLTTFKAGEQFTKSDGSTYTVPEDKTLYVWRKENKLVTFENGDNAFNPMWRFPAANFPAGTIVTIEQIDVGVKLHNPYSESSHLPYDAKKLSSVNYEIVEPTEDVYVNTQMYRPSREADWPLWEGYIADNNVYMGAPGFEHTQERTLGYFTVGNRGTGSSRAKTIIIDYDVNNTGVGGVTAQALPFLSRDYAGAKATKVTDFKVTLWDSNTNRTKTYSYDNPPQRFRVQTVLGDGAHEGVYLKHIEYKIDTIPAKTSFVSYRSRAEANDGSGKEDFNQPTTTLPYFGVVRNNTVIEKGKWGDNPTLFKARIRIENTGDEEPEFNHRNQDIWDWDGDGVAENNKYVGRSKDHVTIGDTFTGFTGKSYIEGHNSGNYAWHDGLIDPVIGEQQADRWFSYFQSVWNGSSTGAQTLNAIYVISPFGSDMSFRLYSRSVGAKQAWMENKNGIEYSAQADVYEVAPSDKLKEAYPKARVYKLDLTKITNEKDKYEMRTGGAQFYWYEAAKAVPYTTSIGYWAYDGDIGLRISYTSDPTKDEARYVGPPGGLSAGWRADEGIVWYEFDTDTKEELVHGGGMTTDRWDLNGNGSTDDLFGRPVGAIEPKSPTDVVVQSAAKMATQPDSRYVTYDGRKRTEIGAESTVDYRLIATNPTQTAANGLTIYWPVPKEGQNWGQAVQPTKKAFEFTMNLNGGIKSELPAGYTVSYARDAEPTSQALKWGGFDWTDEANTASWTAEDWARVNFVRISSPDDAQIQPKEAQTFLFNMKVGDVSHEVAETNPLDVMTPAYLRDLGSGKGYRYGQPVAMLIEPGVITGKVWYDIDNDSIIDKDDDGEDLEQAIPDAVAELRDERGDLVETVRTGEDGTYKFQGLIPGDRDPLGKKHTVTVYNPAPPKTDQGEGASNPYTRFSPVTEKGDVKLTGTADAQKAVSEPVTASLAGRVVLNAGLSRPRAVQVEKIWDENNGAGDQTATTVSEVSVKLLANGKAAKDIDGKAVGNLTLSAAGTWKGTFENLPINDAATNKAIEYTVEEASVPTGYKATVSGSDTAGYKITNKRSKVTVKVAKEWSDAENQDGKRPDSVTVQLKANGADVSGKTLTLSASNSWKGEFAGLLSHDDQGEISYTVAETSVPEGYEATVTGDAAGGFTVTNTLVRGVVSLVKTDAAGAPLVGAVFELRTTTGQVLDTVTSGADGRVVFEGVPAGSYRVVETQAPAGYVLSGWAKAAVIDRMGVSVDLGRVVNTPVPAKPVGPVASLGKRLPVTGVDVAVGVVAVGLVGLGGLLIRRRRA